MKTLFIATDQVHNIASFILPMQIACTFLPDKDETKFCYDTITRELCTSLWNGPVSLIDDLTETEDISDEVVDLSINGDIVSVSPVFAWLYAHEDNIKRRLHFASVKCESDSIRVSLDTSSTENWVEFNAINKISGPASVVDLDVDDILHILTEHPQCAILSPSGAQNINFYGIDAIIFVGVMDISLIPEDSQNYVRPERLFDIHTY